MMTYSAINYLRVLTKTLKLECSLRWTSSDAALKTAPVKSLIKVAIVGAPNSGKSTLINQIVKRKVFPISSKVHTTRWKARAVLNEGNTQLIFVDTPGLVTASESKKYKLSSEFVCDGEDAISDADVIGVVHDLSNDHTNKRLDPKVLRLLHIFQQKESFLILNKIDTIKSKRTLLDLSKKLTGDKLNAYKTQDVKPLSETAIAEIIQEKPIWENFSDIFMISALLGQGVDDLKKYLLNSAHPGEWIFPEDSFTDQNHVQIIEETVRSKLLDALPQEVPYNLKVELEFLDIETSGRIVAVVLVHCKTPRLVGLVKGQKGKRIREINEESKQSLADAFFTDIDLTIIVDQLKKNEGTLPDE